MSEDTFVSHLVELRDRMIRALVAVGVMTLVLSIWPGIGGVYDVLARPMTQALPEGTHMIATGVVSPVFVPLKVTVLAAFLIALPYVLYQAWAFVAPGLYAHEKRIALPLVVMSTVLFLLGIAYCYFVVFGLVFHAIQSLAPGAITPAPDIEAYLSFVMTMFLAFGITFEIPLLQIVLVRTGAVSVGKLREIRGYVIVGAFVVAAVITPPDVLSQLLLAIPMCLLYQLGIFAARFVRPREDNTEEEYSVPAAGPEFDGFETDRKGR